MKRRGSGLLLHITSLPSDYGVGDMGPSAYRFADFLHKTKQGFWQILPLNPIDPAYGNSPYHSTSAFAGSSLLISPELMVRDGFLTQRDVKPIPDFPRGRVDYETVIAYKEKLFYSAYARFKKARDNCQYERFCSENSRWLDDFALFMALREQFHGQVWGDWPPEIRDRQPKALRSLRKEHGNRIEILKFLQYIFSQQWFSLKRYCNQKGIQVIGDLPIYVDYNSVDLWTHPEIFKLDNKKKPSAVAGVPPDYFSKTGQLWGNPVYRWDALKDTGYSWWIERMERTLTLTDLVRIDHFRGLVAYWEVPAGKKTAISGRWVRVPAEDFLNTLLERFSYLQIIAEDLGMITADVKEVMHRFQLPGMKVLLFAFGRDHPMHPYLPHTYGKDCVVYTGTHDNNTIRGWFEREATDKVKKRLFRYLGREVPVEELHWELIKVAMMSVADLVVIPVQDVVGLGEEARMNLPGKGEGNWRWQLLAEQLTASLARRLKEMTKVYGRA